jgi:hypothetical protein
MTTGMKVTRREYSKDDVPTTRSNNFIVAYIQNCKKRDQLQPIPVACYKARLILNHF